MPSARIRRILIGLSLVALLPGAALAADPAPSAGPDPEAAMLVAPFYEQLSLAPGAEKEAQLLAFLAPEYQLLRTNGVRMDAAGYAADPALILSWALVSAVRTTSPEGDLAIVSYVVTTDSTIDGVTQTTTAPRLAAFRQTPEGWRMSALANFTALPPAGATPAPSIPPVAASGATEPSFAPAPTDPELAGVVAYYRALTLPDGPEKVAALDAILAPEFQVLRTNGRNLDRTAFLAEPALVHAFELTDPVITEDPDGMVRIVTFTARTDSTIEGVSQVTTAPRLMVLRNVAGTWLVSGLANLSPLPAPAPSPAG